MMLSPVRIGVLGAGYFGTLHALTVNSLSEARLCAVVDSSATALAKLPSSLAQIPRFLTWKQRSATQMWKLGSLHLQPLHTFIFPAASANRCLCVTRKTYRSEPC